jgi:tight adherence protein B
MTATTWWLGVVTTLYVAVVASGALILCFGEPSSVGQAAARSYVASLDRRLRFLRSRLGGWHVFWLQAALATGLVCAALPGRRWVLLSALLPMVLGPKAMLQWRTAQRVAKIELQMEPWISSLANALKASPSLGEAIGATISFTQAPMAEELDILVKERELGTSLNEALDHMAHRIGSRTLAAMVQALKIAQRNGGNLPEMLESSAAALREFARLEGVVRTKTAEGKSQAFVIGMVPAPLVIGIHCIDRHFFDPLLGSPLGQIIVAAAMVLWLLAVMLASKILAVDV